MQLRFSYENFIRQFQFFLSFFFFWYCTYTAIWINVSPSYGRVSAGWPRVRDLREVARLEKGGRRRLNSSIKRSRAGYVSMRAEVYRRASVRIRVRTDVNGGRESEEKSSCENRERDIAQSFARILLAGDNYANTFSSCSLSDGSRRDWRRQNPNSDYDSVLKRGTGEEERGWLGR